MPPPELPADAPVALFTEPVEIGLGVALREKTYAAVADGFHRVLGQIAHLHEPLLAAQRLDWRLAAVAVTNLSLMRLDLLQQPDRLEVRDNLLPGVLFLHARVVEGPQSINP